MSGEAAALFQAALPSHTITLSDECGNTAAAVMTDGRSQTLCLAEKKDDKWELVVSNAAALRRDSAVVSLLLDTDQTLFWSYSGGTHDTFHASSATGQWRVLSLMSRQALSDTNTSEFHVWYEQGDLRFSTFCCDENDNVLSTSVLCPCPPHGWMN